MSSEQLELYSESVIDPLENSVSTRCTRPRPLTYEANGFGFFQPQGTTAGADVQAPQVQRYLLDISLKQGRSLAVSNKRSGEDSGTRAHTHTLGASVAATECQGWEICESVCGSVAFVHCSPRETGEKNAVELVWQQINCH